MFGTVAEKREGGGGVLEKFGQEKNKFRGGTGGEGAETEVRGSHEVSRSSSNRPAEQKTNPAFFCCFQLSNSEIKFLPFHQICEHKGNAGSRDVKTRFFIQ